MTDSEPVLELVDQIYGAAADPACWQDALDSFTARYPGGRGTILHHDLQLGSGSFPIVSSSFDPAWVARYNAHFAAVNPWLKQLKKRPVGLAVPAEFMLDRSNFLKTEFFSDFMKPQDMLSAVGVTIIQDRDRFIAVSVMFPERTAENERENVGFLQRLAPHFRRAMQLNRQIARARLDGAAAEAGLDRLAVGFSLVDRAARSIFHNKAAERVLAEHDGLALDREGAIVAGTPGETAALRAAITSAVEVLDQDARTGGGMFRVGRPSGKPAYSILVTPVRPRHKFMDAAESMAAIVIADNARKRAMPPAELAAAFGITHAEARVLGLLLEGKSILEAGDMLGISANTARTHLKHIFAKMDCARQSDLLRQVMNHPVWMLDQD
jgi:DNA-binding CsgD family transcriptional regulator